MGEPLPVNGEFSFENRVPKQGMCNFAPCGPMAFKCFLRRQIFKVPGGLRSIQGVGVLSIYKSRGMSAIQWLRQKREEILHVIEY